MIRQIIQAPDVRLLERSEPARIGTPASIIGDLIDTRVHAKGAGLSAVQIGVHLRIAALNPALFSGYSVVINPEIVGHGYNQIEEEEGCLSIGEGKPRFRVRRWATVTVRFMDRKMSWVETGVIRGFAARLIQHEIDHMDGRLIA